MLGGAGGVNIGLISNVSMSGQWHLHLSPNWPEGEWKNLQKMNGHLPMPRRSGLLLCQRGPTGGQPSGMPATLVKRARGVQVALHPQARQNWAKVLITGAENSSYFKIAD